MFKDLGAFAVGMAMREQKEKEQDSYINNYKSSGDVSWLDKTEKANNEKEQFEFLGVTQGLF